MSNRPATIVLIVALVIVIVVMLRWARRQTSRLRLRSADAARRLDALADSTVVIVIVATLLCGAAALLPQSRLPGGLDRAWLVGTTIGLATGIPFAVERRSLRRRLRDLPIPDDPIPTTALADAPYAPAVAALVAGAHDLVVEHLAPAVTGDAPDPDALRLRALSAAAQRDQRTARAYALRATQVDASSWDVLIDTGLALSRRQLSAEGLRLLHRAAELSQGDPRAELALAQGLAMAGRLRDAVAAYERARGRRSSASVRGLRGR